MPKVNPSIAAAHTRRALALDVVGKSDEAVEAAKRALRLDPTLIRVRDWLQSTYKEAGDEEAAARQAKLVQQLKDAGFVEVPQ